MMDAQGYAAQTEQLMAQVEMLIDFAWVPALLVDDNLSVIKVNAAARSLLGGQLTAGADLRTAVAALAAWVEECGAEGHAERVKIPTGAGDATAQVTLRAAPGRRVIMLLNARRPEAVSQNRDAFANMLGEAPNFVACKEAAAAFASKESNILLLGETGTGKEVFARAIHAASSRAGGPFVAINCAAIPETLLESELFGYDSGAFTDARRGGKPGKLELANNGTLFLDEVGDMSPLLQAKLLRVLQDRAVERLGGTRTVKVDYRLIAATNQDLEERVEQGHFRRDLFFRLNVLPIRIPPLRLRRSDILLLARHFLNLYGGGRMFDFAPSAEASLLAHEWPGNVRELENIIQYCLSVETGPIVSVDSLPRYLPRMAADDRRFTLETLLETVEREIIREALERNPGTGGREVAARELGISRAGLYRRLQKYGYLNS